jgi:hypothetical protein
MFAQGPDHDSPSALRGPLSDVYFPAILDQPARETALDALAKRLGPKATVDDPIQGRATGLSGIRRVVDQTASWLVEHAASYAKVASTSGIDRDVTEGTLSLTLGQNPTELPVAVVAERRKSREVELRVYFAAPAGSREASTRGRLVQPGEDLVIPDVVVTLLDALAKGDVATIGAQFEEDGAVRDRHGAEHAKSGGALRTFFARLVEGGGLELERGGGADDGRTCALEFTLVKAHGASTAPRAGLMTFERGDSGLVRALRMYGELEGE